MQFSFCLRILLCMLYDPVHDRLIMIPIVFYKINLI